MPHTLDLFRAFPRSLERTVIPAVDSLGDDWWTSERPLDPVTIAGERIEIPARLYGTDLEGAKTIGAKAKLVRACLLSRHHDGFVREAQIARLLESPTEWSLPYLVQLTAEYVVEIHDKIRLGVEAIPRPLIDAFAKENPKFVEKTKQRVISYWYCYHRNDVDVTDLAASQILGAFGWWRKRDLPMRQERMKWRG